MILVLYLISAALLAFVSIKCADYVDLLDKKTNMSGAFIGGVILAAVTSLPEMVTSISSVFVVNNAELIIGNVLGSNIFNLSIFGVLTFIFAKNFKNAVVGKAHIATMICTLIAYVLVAAVFAININGNTFGQIPVIAINVVSVLILVVYFVSFRFLSSDDADNEEEDTSPLTIKQIVVRFIIAALILVVMSVVVTALTDRLQEMYKLDASLAGAIFLGVATSLPEVASSVTLVRHRNFNAMIGNIVGSNMFNFAIFSFADIISGSVAIYPLPTDVSVAAKNMVFFGALSTLLVMTSVIVQRRQKEKPFKAWQMMAFVVLGIAVEVSYVVSLVLPISFF